MEIHYRKKSLLNSKFIFIMILISLCLAMNVLIYGTHEVYIPYDESDTIELYSVFDQEPYKDNTNNNINHNALNLSKLESNSKAISKKVNSIFIFEAYSTGISLDIILIVAFIIFYLTIFKSLPDEWTLINDKVRLDD